MEIRNGVSTFHAKTRADWRNWLQANHRSEKSVWLIIYKKESGVPSVYYSDAVDEALCFGWIDSKPNKRDQRSYYQFFSKRNPKSNWSKVNKDKVKYLLDAGQIEQAGLEMIEIAKRNGTWVALDDVENLVIPEDMKREFDKNPKALVHWTDFPRSVKRGILEWIFNAKRAGTREKRIIETVKLAADNIRANQYTW